MALADLDAQIYEAHANNADLYSIFFNIENAFPKVWTYLNYKTLHQIGLPLLIQIYLQNRLFEVLVSNILSTIKHHKNGIPEVHLLVERFFL